MLLKISATLTLISMVSVILSYITQKIVVNPLVYLNMNLASTKETIILLWYSLSIGALLLSLVGNIIALIINMWS